VGEPSPRNFIFAEGAISGIKYFVDPDLLKGEGSAIGLEFRVLDDVRHPDTKMGVGGNRTAGSLYDLIPAENLSEAGPILLQDHGDRVHFKSIKIRELNGAQRSPQAARPATPSL